MNLICLIWLENAKSAKIWQSNYPRYLDCFSSTVTSIISTTITITAATISIIITCITFRKGLFVFGTLILFLYVRVYIQWIKPLKGIPILEQIKEETEQIYLIYYSEVVSHFCYK